MNVQLLQRTKLCSRLANRIIVTLAGVLSHAGGNARAFTIRALDHMISASPELLESKVCGLFVCFQRRLVPGLGRDYLRTFHASFCHACIRGMLCQALQLMLHNRLSDGSSRVRKEVIDLIGRSLDASPTLLRSYAGKLIPRLTDTSKSWELFPQQSPLASVDGGREASAVVECQQHSYSTCRFDGK